jgi:hypothetical protein
VANFGAGFAGQSVANGIDHRTGYDFLAMGIDAFGNALGNSIVGAMQQTDAEKTTANVEQGLAEIQQQAYASSAQAMADETQAFGDRIATEFGANVGQDVVAAEGERTMLYGAQAGFSVPGSSAALINSVANMLLNIASSDGPDFAAMNAAVQTGVPYMLNPYAAPDSNFADVSAINAYPQYTTPVGGSLLNSAVSEESYNPTGDAIGTLWGGYSALVDKTAEAIGIESRSILGVKYGFSSLLLDAPAAVGGVLALHDTYVAAESGQYEEAIKTGTSAITGIGGAEVGGRMASTLVEAGFASEEVMTGAETGAEAFSMAGPAATLGGAIIGGGFGIVGGRAFGAYIYNSEIGSRVIQAIGDSMERYGKALENQISQPLGNIDLLFP